MAKPTTLHLALVGLGVFGSLGIWLGSVAMPPLQFSTLVEPASRSGTQSVGPDADRSDRKATRLGGVRNTLWPQQLATQWIVSPAEAKDLIEQGATVLDVRDRPAQRQGRIQGAIAVNWQQFSQPDAPDRGKLLSDNTQLTQKLQSLGISTQQPVVVVGNPDSGWGEEGRLVWMLRTLGHDQSVFVDGGFTALSQTGLPLTTTIQEVAAVSGDFIVQRTPRWTVQRDELRQALKTQSLVIVDTREHREFAGATPYGEQRGGHIPGAIHLHYQELLKADGSLRSRDAIQTLLNERRIPSDAVIVSYCTGGVRSGWLTTVLVDLGFHAKNYAGSMWEWSAAPAADYPLMTLSQR